MNPAPQARRLQMFGAIVALDILILDQASKWWVLEVFDLPEKVSVAVLPMLNLTMVWNRGITFGLLNSDSAVASTVLAAVALALGAVAGGAVGNVIDRLRFGAVVDFIHLHAWGWSWYVFNVADAAIVVGVGVLLLDSLLSGRSPGPPRQPVP